MVDKVKNWKLETQISERKRRKEWSIVELSNVILPKSIVPSEINKTVRNQFAMG